MSRFSLVLMDHFQAPRNYGRIPAPDAVGQFRLEGRGPQVTFYLQIADGVVAQARFETAGCGVAIAACSLLSVVATNRSIDACLAVTAEDLDAALGGLPTDKRYCADLAVAALHAGLRSLGDRSTALARGAMP